MGPCLSLPTNKLTINLENRSLSAILFTDISGFTGWMQQDESAALQLLRKNREIHQTLVPAFKGKIVKELGDGMLCVFSTVTDAMDAGMALQQAAREIPNLGLGMGLHAGEILSENEDIFGDAVNLASRIQSMGQSGAIVFSEAVYQAIRNKSQYKSAIFGNFQFKNVQMPMTLYYWDHPTLTVPNRKNISGKLTASVNPWKIPALALSICIFIFLCAYFFVNRPRKPLNLPTIPHIKVGEFVNQTRNPEWDPFGHLIGDWLEQCLVESEKVIVYFNKDTKTGVLTASKSGLHNGWILRGTYYLHDTHQMALTAEIVDTRTGQILYSMPSVKSNLGNFQHLLDETKQYILGYCLSAQSKIKGNRPPRYDAYVSFRKAIETPSDEIYQKETYLVESIHKDSAFIQPYLSLIELSGNWGHTRLMDSILNLLELRQKFLTDYQFLQLESLKARFSGDLSKSAVIQQKLFEQYHLETGATKSIYYHVSSNQAASALKVYHQFNPIERNPGSGNPKDQAYLGDVTEAYMALGHYDSVIHLVQELKFPVLNYTIALSHLEALTRLKQWDSLNHQLRLYQLQLPLDQRWYSPPILPWKIACSLYIHHDTLRLKHYVDQLDAINEAHPNNMFYHYFRSMVHYFKGNFIAAAEAYKVHYDQTPQFRFFLALPAVCYLKAGKKDLANRWINTLQQDAKGYPGQLEYAQGIITAHRSDFNEAILLLKKAFASGYEFDFYSYQNDLLLTEWMHLPEFVKFTSPKS